MNSVTLTTDSFDSTQGPYTSPENGGSVGVNGRVDANGAVTIGGSLLVGSALGIQSGGAGDVWIAGELRDGGPFRSGAPLTVQHDASVNGEVRASALDITGKLTLPTGENIDVSGANHTGSIVRAPVTVDPPCACADSEILDIASLVQEQKIHAQNSTIGLGDDELSNYAGPVDKTLPCGVYYLSRIGGQGDLTLHITGRTALLIGGDVAPGGTFSIVIEGGELDLFVQNGIVSSSPLVLGSQDAPAKVRVYVGGNGTIQLSASSVFGGNLYAPRSEVVTSGGVELYGSVFARRLAASDAVTIHYDTAVLNEGDGCDPPTGCNSCNDCGNQACIDGACGSCTDSSQCCSPLVCDGGNCVPFIQ